MKWDIRVQSEDFDPGYLIGLMEDRMSSDSGAAVTFTGYVKNIPGKALCNALEIEHYPDMVLPCLYTIVQEAAEISDICDALVVHRYGLLPCGSRIVFVGVSSHKRYDAFNAAEYIMQKIKTQVPFWKKEHTDQGSFWVST